MPEPDGPAAGSGNHSLNTLPRLLVEHARVRPDRPAMREKDLGIWQTWSWSEMAAEIESLAAGLLTLGLQRGQKIAVIGDNRPRLYWSMVAAQTIGAIPVPLYQDAVALEMVYVLNDADIAMAVVEDQEQVDKLLEIRDDCPKLHHIIYDDPRGLGDYAQPYVHGFGRVQEAGKAYVAEHPGFFAEGVERTRGEDTAIILYTSGTTGNPKGVMLSHDNLVITARNGVEQEGLSADEEVLAYLPMAWVGDNTFSLAQSYVAGFCVNCPESPETVMTDMREVGPTYYFAPPRVYENLLTQVMIRMEDASAPKRKVFQYFMDHARKVGTDILDGRPVAKGARFKYWLGNLLVYAPLRNVLGFSRIRLAYTAGEAIGPDIFDFYRSLGINVKQLYGQTEATVFICVQPNGEVRADTVGSPARGVEVKIADNGEVLYRSAGVFQSYYKNEKSTRATKTEDGWVLTGDAGYFDDQGHLHIIDRAKDVGKLVDGTLFAPKFIENKLKFFPEVKEAVVFGADRAFATVFINIDLEAVGNWAERNNLAYTGFVDLAGRPEVAELVRKCVEKVNEDLAQDPRLGNSQLHRFLVLPKELDPDDGELTRTRKVRRGFVAERYETLIEAMYAGDKTVDIDMEIKFEDGRAGRLQADVAIYDARTTAVAEYRKAS